MQHPTQRHTQNKEASKHKLKDEDDAKSSEAAGIVRGSMRTIKAFFPRRSPPSSSSSSSSMTVVAIEDLKVSPIPSNRILQRSPQRVATESSINPSYKTTFVKTFAIPKKAFQKGITKKPVVRASEHLVHDVTSMAIGDHNEHGKIEQKSKDFAQNNASSNKNQKPNTSKRMQFSNKAYFISSCKC
jgi:hypothetical protein